MNARNDTRNVHHCDASLQYGSGRTVAGDVSPTAQERPTPRCDFQKKACGSGVVRVMAQMSIFLGNSGKTAERRWHTDIDRRSLVWKILSGARLSRREEALPVSCES
jgi:hypothetical protein